MSVSPSGEASVRPGPSDTELDVLKAFWRDGELSGREVQDRIGETMGWTSSTTRTVLERMRAKGLLSRRSVHGVAVYAATQPKVAVIGGLMRRLGTMLEIDGALPAAALSGSQILDAEEIAALDALLAADMAEGGDA
jgi:predicted transcriptional regulator